MAKKNEEPTLNDALAELLNGGYEFWAYAQANREYFVKSLGADKTLTEPNITKNYDKKKIKFL